MNQFDFKKAHEREAALEARVNDLAQEAVALGDTKINTSKLWAKPERAGVAVPITRQALNETEDLLQTIFTEYAPAAIAELQNHSNEWLKLHKRICE